MDESFIVEKLEILRKRFKKVLLFERMIKYLYWGTSIATGILIILKSFGYNTPYTYLSLIPIIMAIIIPIGMFFLQKVPLSKVALISDNRLQLKERMSTVLEWIEQNRKRTLMFKGLLRDAAFNVQKIVPEKLFPCPPPKRYIRVLVTISIVCLLIVIPPWGIFNPVINRDEAKNIRTTMQKVEKQVVEIEKNMLMKPALKRDIKRRTDEIKKLVKNPANMDKKKTIAKISDLKDKLKEEQKRISRNKSLLEKLKDRNSSSSSKTGTGQGQQQRASEKMKAMAEKLKKENLTREELKKIKQSLSSAKGHFSSESELRKDLEKALKNLAQINRESAAQTVDEIAQKLRQMESECCSEKDIENLTNDLDRLKNFIAGNTEISPQELSETNSTLEGEPGSNPVNGKEGAGGNATEIAGMEKKYTRSNEKRPADYGVGTTNKEQKSAGEDSPNYVIKRQNDKESHWKEFYERLYKSERYKMDSAGTMVKGQISGPQGTYMKGDIRGGIPKSGVSKSEPRVVYSIYKGKAEQAITREKIPKEYKTLVRDYFKEIDPSK